MINTGRATDRIQTLISSLLTYRDKQQTDRLTSADHRVIISGSRQTTDRQRTGLYTQQG